MSFRQFSFGERIVHAGRPEWGAGVVTAAQPAEHEGRTCQRLTVRFERAGLKTLNTALAELVPESEASHILASARPAAESTEAAARSDDRPAGWLAQLEASPPEVQAERLPEATRDPFTSLEARLRATLSLYRFTDQGASLLDWASAQFGLRDPLARFNRHELEVLFKRFVVERDAHLKRLLSDARRSDPGLAERVLAEAPPTARLALKKLHADR